MHAHAFSALACARFQCTCMRTLSGTRALEDWLGPTRRAPAEIARYTTAHMRRQADLTASSPRSARSCKRQRKGVCAHARKPRVRMHRASAHTHAPGRAAPREAGSCEPAYRGSTPAPDRSNSTTRTPSPRSSSQAAPSQLSKLGVRCGGGAPLLRLAVRGLVDRLHVRQMHERIGHLLRGRRVPAV
jgi:hypothetical protein